MSVIERAPAKINLGLKVVRKRHDGFHDILSVFQTVSLFDTLELEEAEQTNLTCDIPGLSCGPENLVLKAEQLLRTVFPDLPGTQFQLTKRIPAGGGLGGGSSDAAAALRGLLKLYNLNLDISILSSLSEKIGSDIPFLIHGGTAIISGKGEQISPVQWPFDFHYVIVHPDISVSTAWAYNNLDSIGNDIEHYEYYCEKLKNRTIEKKDVVSFCVNDFEPSVFKQFEILYRVKNKLLSYGAKASVMTGSGSCVIGIFDDQATGEKCRLSMDADGFEVFSARTYNRI